LRVLKELVSRVEASIEDWDEHVSPDPGRDMSVSRIRQSLT
jgi:hypothetical protein